ncbi:protein POLR1D-like [Chelmon rostratus]|uniref:protein POLR1D-like n=1 Tax=Chelmon rostratus TaxID=109905 RepID=UPI001BEA0D9C|nr:protein POLR1D-like [Chelmon rostratus]
MAEENDLEKRAVEELLRETDRARVRAETMGPAGWLKCPLRSTNKRFLLNTLRSTGLQGRSAGPRDGHSITRGRLRSDSPDRSRDRSRTPSRDHRSNGGHTDHKHHHRDSCNNKDKKQARDRERSHRHKDNRERGHGRDGPSRDKDKDRLHE